MCNIHLVFDINKANAELAVREMLQEIAIKTKEHTAATRLHAVDFMDDGTKIAVTIDIDETKVRNHCCMHQCDKM